MKKISVTYDENVIIGMDTKDDAGVYKLTDDIAIIQTVDFITPIVDDPFTYGQIAVCNSLSDVYAMGGRPVTAMNIVCFPTGKFTLDILSKVLIGGMDILKKAGVQLLGGHSVEDEEMKYGVSVTGVVHPERAVRNNGLKEGDSIILTKPLGTGIIATAIKSGLASEDIIEPFVKPMTTLNRRASELMLHYDIHACTDVTGFGLAGHLMEMISEDKVEIIVDSKTLPIIPGTVDNASMGLIPAGMYRNRDYVGSLCKIETGVKQELADIIFDPQTSGGLLISLPENDAFKLLKDLHADGIKDAAIIAHIKENSSKRITLL